MTKSIPSETSFAEILRAKMTEINGFSEEKAQRTQQKMANFRSENVVFHSEKIPFLDLETLQFTLKMSDFRSQKRDFTIYKSEKAKFPEPPLPARDWNETQKLALNSLISLGAKELTTCSTDRQITKAFRRLAKLLHPDLNKNHAQGQAFIELHACYKTLIKK